MTTPLLPAFTGAPDLNRVYHCDALTLLRALPDASVDLIATDPPYGIGYASSWTTRSDGTPRRTNGSFGADVFDASWIPDAARVLKPCGAMYMCTRWDMIHQWHNAIEAAGLRVVQRIIWDKQHWGAGDLRYFGSQVEDVLFAVKGEHQLRSSKRSGNLWSINGRLAKIAKDGHFDNPTQKPVALMRRMIELSSDAGALVVDPFCGSGTTAVAARRAGRRFITCDVSAYQVEIARRRLAQPYTPDMFALAELAQQQGAD